MNQISCGRRGGNCQCTSVEECILDRTPPQEALSQAMEAVEAAAAGDCEPAKRLMARVEPWPDGTPAAATRLTELDLTKVVNDVILSGEHWTAQDIAHAIQKCLPTAVEETRQITEEDRQYASELLADLRNGGEPRLYVAAQWFRKARVEHSLPGNHSPAGSAPAFQEAACPFCGSLDSFVERSDLSSSYVICNECGAQGPTECQDGDEEETPGGDAAKRAWNKRAGPEPLEWRGEIKRLQNELVQARALVEGMRSALDSIAGWRNVNISNEYESGLRDIIHSVTDCASAALDTATTLPSTEGK